MDDQKDLLRCWTERSFERLLGLYPPRFQREFSAEIYAIFLQRMDEAGAQGRTAWFASAVREILGLMLSIQKECWHEWLTRKGKKMASEDQMSKGAGSGLVLQTAGAPGFGPIRVAGWILLTTAVFPAALFFASPLALPYMWIFNLGAKAGLWPAGVSSSPEIPGFITALALGMAAAEWLMLRKTLPRPGIWFAATAGGIWLAGLVLWGYYLAKINESWDPFWSSASVLLMAGLALGLAQWLYARRLLPKALWIIPINLLACGSLLFLQPVISSYGSLVAFLAFALPGTITGVGMWLLLKQAQINVAPISHSRVFPQRRRLNRILWTGVVLAALVPLYFLSIYTYAAARIALAKNQGVYPTIEAAVIATNSQGFGDAQVISVENVRAEPNYGDGRQPFMWYGTATINLDRIPRGYTKASFHGGSYYMHVRDGWVFMPESAFPEFVGWVMELYHMEGVS
jgi:hypothetical protein